jgi:hypothetical protein
MPVSKKRKKDGKPVQHQAASAEKHAAEHPEDHSGPPPLKAGKPRNPFVGQQPQHRGAQRGR